MARPSEIDIENQQNDSDSTLDIMSNMLGSCTIDTKPYIYTKPWQKQDSKPLDLDALSLSCISVAPSLESSAVKLAADNEESHTPKHQTTRKRPVIRCAIAMLVILLLLTAFFFFYGTFASDSDEPEPEQEATNILNLLAQDIPTLDDGNGGSLLATTKESSSVSGQIMLLARIVKQQQEIIDGLMNDPRPGPKGDHGTCVGVLGGSELWVGGKPQTSSTCGGGWYKCSVTRGQEPRTTTYYPPSSGKMTAKVGDKLLFAHRSWSSGYSLWRLPDKAAFDACDFSGANATVLSDGKNSVRGYGSEGRLPYEIVLGPGNVGDMYFAAGDVGMAEALKGTAKDYCGFMKIKVHVHVASLQEVALSSGGLGLGSGSDSAASSATVQRLQGVVQALGRVSVMTQLQHEQRLRSEGGSGISTVRGQSSGTKDYNDPSYARSGIMSMHNHADYKNTVGMGEIGAVLNGVEFITRHNDYSLSMPHPDSSKHEYSGLVPVPRPKVPPAVSNKGSVAEQVGEMREWFRAWKAQDWTVRDYRPYFTAHVCVLEGAWVTENEEFGDPFASERHQIDAASWKELHDKVRYLANSGRKHNDENLAYLPQAVRRMVKQGNGTITSDTTTEPSTSTSTDDRQNSVSFTLPELANWEYRILCQPIKSDVPTSRFRVARDLGVQLYSRPQTVSELHSSRRARFEVLPEVDLTRKGEPSPVKESNVKLGLGDRGMDDEWAAWQDRTSSWNYLDWLMEQVPGKDGSGANSTDEWDASYAMHHVRDEELLNVGYYSRYYNVKEADAMGQNKRRRGWSDGYLWAAKSDTFAKKLSPLTAWDDKAGRERSGAWTYAIPLEVVYTTPLSEWNPLELVDLHRPDNVDQTNSRVDFQQNPTPLTRQDGTDNVSPRKFSAMDLVDGKHELVANGGSLPKARTGLPNKDGSCDVQTAYNGVAHSQRYFVTPHNFYSEPEGGVGDAADTSAGAVCVLDKHGQAHLTRAAGVYISTPSIGGGVGAVRTRYPIAPLHVQGGTEWKELKALQELAVPEDYEADNGESVLFGDRRDGKYGFELTLAGGTHTHGIRVSAGNVRRWEAMGGFTSSSPMILELGSELANGHEHVVQISRTRASTKDAWRYYVEECKTAGDAQWDSEKDAGITPKTCLDGHSVVSRTISV